MFQRLKQHLQQSFYGSGNGNGYSSGGSGASGSSSPIVRRAHASLLSSVIEQHPELNVSDGSSSSGASPHNTWYFRPHCRGTVEPSSGATIEFLCAQQIALDVVGHAFLPFEVPAPTWCDQCADFIWGLYRASQRCKYCNFTCHSRCMRNVDYACPGNPQMAIAQSSAAQHSAPPATHQSQAHIRIEEHIDAPHTNAHPQLQSQPQWNTQREQTQGESEPVSNIGNTRAPATFTSPVFTVTGEMHNNKPKQLATVFDASFDENGMKSPLGLVDADSGLLDPQCLLAALPGHTTCNQSCRELQSPHSEDACTQPDAPQPTTAIAGGGTNASDDDSIGSGSLRPHNAVGNVPAYAFTSLDKWSMRRFRIRVNEVQPHAATAHVDKLRPTTDCDADGNANWSLPAPAVNVKQHREPDDEACDLLSDVAVNDYVTDSCRTGHAISDCNYATAVCSLSKAVTIADGNNLSLPIRLTRCDYAHVIDERERAGVSTCDCACQCEHCCTEHHAETDSFHTAKTSPFLDGLTASCTADGDPELQWFVTLQQQPDGAFDRCLSVFTHNTFGFAAHRLTGADADVHSDGVGVSQLNGAIRVYINLIRPIKMALSARPLTIYDLLPAANGVPDAAAKDEQLETFLLPRGTTRLLYISSTSTSSQLICCLLRKFHIRDNPRKFALYEHTIESEHDVTIRKLVDHERPLLTCLRWTLDAALDRDAFLALLAKKRIVLQENESGDIDWEAFSTPELNNFLLILQREEDERLREIRHKYRLIKREFQRILKEAADRQQPASNGELHSRAE